MLTGDDSSFVSFEDQLEKVIADLEDALWGVSDEEIRADLEEKGYNTFDGDEFRAFKDSLKQIVTQNGIRDIVGSSRDNCCIDDNEDDTDRSEISISNDSSDFDVSISSYMELPRFHEIQPSFTEFEFDLLRPISPDNSPRRFEDFLSENVIIPGDIHSFDDSPLPNDLVTLNPELPQPSLTTERIPRRNSHNAERPKNPHRIPSKKQSNVINISTAQRQPQSSRTECRESFEQFVRRECKEQLDLLDRISGRSRSTWVPTTPKCSPLVRYQQYKKFWDKFPVPGTKARKDLRWTIRNQMAKKEVPQKVSWWPELRLPS